MPENNSLESSIVDSIASSHIQNVVGDISEVVVDSLLQDGVLRDIPIISTIVGIKNTWFAIRDHNFLKKVMHFLWKIEDIPIAKREKFVEQLNNNPKEKQKTGENLILILDRLDDMRKAEILGCIFKRYINSEIDQNMLRLLYTALDRIFLPYLDKYISGTATSNWNYVWEPSPEITTNLINAGVFSYDLYVIENEKHGPLGEIVNKSPLTEERGKNVRVKGKLTALGKKLIQIIKEDNC